MKTIFTNDTPVNIPAQQPTQVSSSIDVTDLALGANRITVTIDLVHTYTSDLTLTLVSPTQDRVQLVNRSGGSGDNFLATTFDDAAAISITGGRPPFSGTFRPIEPLARLQNSAPEGRWTLEIVDNAALDGGALNRWSLDFTSLDTGTGSNFTIDVRFNGGLNAAQQAVFETAAARWSEVITGDLPAVQIDGDQIDDVLIEAEGIAIDGPNGILGQAGPTRLRSGSLLPATGIMQFDVGDLARLEADGGLLNVIIHEMGHVLGLGTLWNTKGLLAGAGSPNPIFTGNNAMREFGALLAGGTMTPVPVANTGGQGTRDGHWREAVFGSELMTGFLNFGVNPLSRLTIASFEDLGYTVNYDAADPYQLPTSLELAIMGIGAEGGYSHRQCRMCNGTMARPVPTIV